MRSVTNSCSLSNEKFQQNAAIFLLILAGCGKEEADRDRGAGDQEEGEGADGHRKAPRRGRGLQGPNCRRRNEVSGLSKCSEALLLTTSLCIRLQ